MFKLGEGKISYPKSSCEYAHLYGEFVKKSLIAVGNMVVHYNRERDLSGIVNNVVPFGKKLFDELIDEMIKIMFEKGLIINKKDFIFVMGDVYDFNYYSKVDSVKGMYNQIMQQKNELMQQEMMRRSNRGRWQGGGFGIKGAVKGAVTASVLNASSNILHSFGDISHERANNQFIRNSLISKKYSSGIQSVVCDELGNCVMKAFEYCGTLLKNEKCMTVIETNIKTAETVYENTNNIYKDNVYKRNEVGYGRAMFEAILNNPGNKTYYDEAMEYILFLPHDDLIRFLDFWNIRFFYPECNDEAIELGKKFDEEFLEKMCVDGQNQLKYTWEGYVETRVFCLDFYKRHNINSMPEFSASKVLLDSYYETLCKKYDMFMSWYGVVEWIPIKASLDEFFVYLQCERESIKTSYLPFIWLKGDDESELLDIGKDSICEIVRNENVYMCINCSLLNDWSRGLIVTDREFIDVHNTNNRILLRNVVELYDNDSNHAIIIRGDNKKIVLKDGISGIINTLAANIHLIRILHVLCVRYADNGYLWVDRMSTPKPHGKKEIDKNDNIISASRDKNHVILNEVEKEDVKISDLTRNESMFCAFCGKEILRKSKYCNYCGKKNNYTIKK